MITSRLHPRYKTPHYAVLVTGGRMISAILFADLALVLVVSTLSMLMYYAIINLTALKIPRNFQVYPVIFRHSVRFPADLGRYFSHLLHESSGRSGWRVVLSGMEY